MSKSEYEEIFLWHENIRDYSSSETIFTLHKHLLWKLIYINQGRNSNKRNLRVIKVSGVHIGPHYHHLGRGHWSWLVTRCAPHGQPIMGSRPCVSMLTSLPRDRSIRGMRGWLCLSLSVSLHFILSRRFRPQIIPAVTSQLRTPSSKHLTSKFSWALRSYLLMLERGKIRFISSFLSLHPQLDHWPAFGR